jgi:hypothetical protein
MNCFLVSLVSLALIACFLVSESVGHHPDSLDLEVQLDSLSFFKIFFDYRHSLTVPVCRL